MMKKLFNTPVNFEELMEIMPLVTTSKAYDEAHEYAVDIARAEGYPEPVEQASIWMEQYSSYKDGKN